MVATHLQLPQALPFQLGTRVTHAPGQTDVEGGLLWRNSGEADGHLDALVGSGMTRGLWRCCHGIPAGSLAHFRRDPSTLHRKRR